MDYTTVLIGHIVIAAVTVTMAFFYYLREWKRHSIVRRETKKLRARWE